MAQVWAAKAQGQLTHSLHIIWLGKSKTCELTSLKAIVPDLWQLIHTCTSPLDAEVKNEFAFRPPSG